MTDLVSPDSKLPPVLQERHLELVASWLLEEWAATEDDLVRDTDTSYTRGTTRFGRQQKRFWLEALSGRHPWLRVLNNSLDIVFEIQGIPCRFSNDNAESPRKRAVVQVHQHQMMFLEEAEPGDAARFVFVLDCGIDEASEPRVVLLGFSAAGREVCRWTSGGKLRRIGEANASLPCAVELPRPRVSPKRQRDGEGASAAASAAR